MEKKKYDHGDVERWLGKIAAGQSMRGIAREEGVKPGVIAGRLHRARGGTKTPKGPRKPKAEKKQKEKRSTTPKKPRRPDMKRPELDGPDIISLGASKCKFPVTHDRPYKFCGEEATHGPYCKHHYELTTDSSPEAVSRIENAVKWITAEQNPARDRTKPVDNFSRFS